MKLKLVLAPAEILNKKATPIEEINSKIIELAHLMHYYMGVWGGIGLAAPQVGRGIQLIVVNTLKFGGAKLALINPEITNSSDEKFKWEEGCLSFPGMFITNDRPRIITVKYLDLQGNERIEDFKDLTAFCLQHEIDHLRGITMDDIVIDISKKIE